MSLYSFFYYLMLWVDILPIFFCVLFFFFVKNRRIKLLYFLYLLFSLIVQWSSYFLSINGFSSLPLANFYNLFEFATLFFIFKSQNPKNIFRIFILPTAPIFLSVYILDFRTENLMQNALITSSVIYIFLTIVTFISKLKFSENFSTLNSFENYFNLGILTYFSCAIILFTVFDMLNPENFNIWIVHNIVEIISKLIFTLAIWKMPLKLTS
jgi:hypothetical protein